MLNNLFQLFFFLNQFCFRKKYDIENYSPNSQRAAELNRTKTFIMENSTELDVYVHESSTLNYSALKELWNFEN